MRDPGVRPSQARLARFLPSSPPPAMRVAIPLHGEEVSPRFCATDRFLVVDVEDGLAAARQVLPVTGTFDERLHHLAGRGVTDLLCGGFNRHFLPLAWSLGLRVTWGLWGDAEQVLADWQQGRLPPPIQTFSRRGRGPGCGRRGRGWT